MRYPRFRTLLENKNKGQIVLLRKYNELCSVNMISAFSKVSLINALDESLGNMDKSKKIIKLFSLVPNNVFSIFLVILGNVFIPICAYCL